MEVVGLVREQDIDVKSDFPDIMDDVPDPGYYLNLREEPRNATLIRLMSAEEVAEPIKWFRTLMLKSGTYRLYQSNISIPYHLQTTFISMNDLGTVVHGTAGGRAIVAEAWQTAPSDGAQSQSM